MNRQITWTLALLATTALVMPALASAQDAPKRATTAPASTTPSRTVDKKDDEAQAGLLLPAVQNVRATSGTAENQAAGVEPDEIDNKATDQEPQERAAGYMKIGDIKGESTEAHSPGGGATGQSRRRGVATTEDMSSAAPARELDKATPKLMEANAGGRRASTQQMMVKLKPRTSTLVASGQGGNPTPGDKVAQPGQSQAYEIAECGTATNPMICCHHEAGDGSTCNMFQMLCENAGGTAQGDATDATCSDWP